MARRSDPPLSSFTAKRGGCARLNVLFVVGCSVTTEDMPDMLDQFVYGEDEIVGLTHCFVRF